MTDQLEKHQVAVTVFLEADGRDACHAAVLAVADKLKADGPVLTTQTYRGMPRTVRVVDVSEIGTAFGAGLLRVSPATSVYRNEERQA